jgi:hypothetical protein
LKEAIHPVSLALLKIFGVTYTKAIEPKGAKYKPQIENKPVSLQPSPRNNQLFLN